jgi:hypothetical protein
MANYVSVVQNAATGVVDYLEFSGTTLVASAAFNYGLASGFQIVADGEFNDHIGFPTPDARSWDLVAQNVSNPNFPIGQLDFLYLDHSGNLIGSALSAVVPTVRGEGQFGTVAGQTGPTLVSQLPDGSLDMLAFNASGTLIGSDLIPGTAGLPRVVGIADFGPVHDFSYYNSTDPTLGSKVHAPENIVTQLPDGHIDIIGLSGSMATGLSYTSSNLLPTPVPPVEDVNPTGANLGSNFFLFTSNPPSLPLGQFLLQGDTVQMVSQLPSGQIDQIFFDAQTAAFTGSLPESYTQPPGWIVTDGGQVATEVLPLTAFSDYPGFVFL